jgi:acetoin utilization protein AcuB
VEVDVKAWMSGDPVAIEADASALEALELMTDRGIRHLPVVDAQRRVIGVLSVDDLRAAMPFSVSPRSTLSPDERSLAREWQVGEVMTHAPETTLADAPLADAVERMAERRIGCLPVVDAGGVLVGVLSETDALHALSAALHSERVQEERTRLSDLDELVVGLRAERARIATRLDHYHEVERALSAEQHDSPMDGPERGADLREVRLTEGLDALSARRLAAIDRALDHAAQGRLSVRDDCGGTIPLARLRALPGTTRCVACARAAEHEAREAEVPFERVPGGRAETGRPELGARVYTRFGEGQLLRIVPFGTCPRCGDVEGHFGPGDEAPLCARAGCRRALEDPCERAIVRVDEREVYVDPAVLRPVDPSPYD